MAATESIGSVSVLIGGDYSPLITAFGQAQAAAAKAGQSVASAFTGGAAAAPGLVDQFGRAVGSAAAPTKTLADVCAQLASIQAVLEGNVNRSTTALTRQAAAAHGAVTEIQATSGALRVLEGSGGIRAAERFLTMIPGLGAGLQAAFPVVGAIALGAVLLKLGEEAYKAGQNFLFLKDAAEAADKLETDFARDSTARMLATERLQASQQERHGDFTGGARKSIQADEQTPIRLSDKFKEFGKELEPTLGQLDSFYPKFLQLSTLFSDVVPEDAPKRVAKMKDAIADLRGELSRFDSSNPLGEHMIEQRLRAIEVLQSGVKNLTLGRDFQDSSNQFKTQDAGERQSKESSEIEIQKISVQQKASEALTQINNRRVDDQADAQKRAAQIEIAGYSSAAGRADANAQLEVDIAKKVRDGKLAELSAQLADAQRFSRQIFDQQSRSAFTPKERSAADTGQHTRDISSDQTFRSGAAQLDKTVTDAEDALQKVRAAFAREIGDGIAASFRNIGDGWEKLQAQMLERAHRTGEALTKIFEIEDKSKGETGQLAIQGQKLQLERQYGLEVAHTGQQQVAYQKQLADLDAKARQAKISGVQGAIGEISPDTQEPAQMVKRAELEAQLAQLQAESNNAAITAQTKILELIEQQTLQYQLRASIARAGQAVAPALGNALASAVTGGGGKHEDVGQEISKALAGVGKQLLGGVFTAVIHQLIASLLATAIAQHVMAAIFGTNTGVQAANTTAVAALATSNGGLIISQTAVIVSNGALTAAITALTVAVGVETALLGFADGGSPPVGVPSIVGERGPEIFVPKGAGTIIPNHMVKGYANGAGLSLLPSAAGHSSVAHTAAFSGDMHIHIPAQASPRRHAEQIFSELPKVAKSKSSSFSPYSK